MEITQTKSNFGYSPQDDWAAEAGGLCSTLQFLRVIKKNSGKTGFLLEVLELDYLQWLQRGRN